MHVNTINTLNWHCFIVLSCVHTVHTDQARNQTIRACGQHSPAQSDTPLFVVFVTTLGARLCLDRWITSLHYADTQTASIQRITHNNRRDKDGNEPAGCCGVCLISSHTTPQQHNINSIRSGFCGVMGSDENLCSVSCMIWSLSADPINQ